MNLELLSKDPGSGNGGCPSVHLDHEDGMCVAQGPQVNTSELPSCLPGEVGVKLSPQIILEAMRVYRAKGLL